MARDIYCVNGSRAEAVGRLTMLLTDFSFLSFFFFLLQLLVQAAALYVLTVTRELSRVLRIEFLGYSPFLLLFPVRKSLQSY